MWLLEAHKKGISSCQLARDIAVTQKTAWFMLQRIRDCFFCENNHQLDGEVVLDETFVGGKNKNKHSNKKVKNSCGRSFIDKTGEIIIPLKYDLALRFSERLAAIQLNGKCGFIDKTGEVVIPFKYDKLGTFSNGLARVSLNGKFMYIDKQGNEIMQGKAAANESAAKEKVSSNNPTKKTSSTAGIPNAVLGVPFGASMEQAEAIMEKNNYKKNHPGINYREESELGYLVDYYAGFPGHSVTFFFYKNRCWKAWIIIHPNNINDVITVLSTKYGQVEKFPDYKQHTHNNYIAVGKWSDENNEVIFISPPLIIYQNKAILSEMQRDEAEKARQSENNF
jgi:hypothetical protein